MAKKKSSRLESILKTIDKSKTSFDLKVDEPLIKTTIYGSVVTLAYNSADIIRNVSGKIADLTISYSPQVSLFLEDQVNNYLLDNPEPIQAASLVAAGLLIGKRSIVNKFAGYLTTKANKYTNKQRQRHRGSGKLGWLKTATLTAALASQIFSAVNFVMPSKFVDTGDNTSGGYDIFEYRGRARRTGDIADIFDSWDQRKGDKCNNVGTLNIFYNDNGGAFVKAGCNQEKIDQIAKVRNILRGDDDDTLDGTYPIKDIYTPYSKDAIALFSAAAELAGVPKSWADSDALHWILEKESNGIVGVPNYTIKLPNGKRARDYPDKWSEIHRELRSGILKPGSSRARSSATGLGQLLTSNVVRYYPEGMQGIGNPLQEAAGMLLYIQDRYGSPERAKQEYGKRHEGY